MPPGFHFCNYTHSEFYFVIENESMGNNCGVFLSKKSTDLFILAEKTLDNLYNEVSGGLMKLEDIKVVNDNKPQVIKLLKAVQKQSMDDFCNSLEVREQEFTAFKRRKLQLASFCHFMESFELKIEGI